jgi:hypothetical protein
LVLLLTNSVDPTADLIVERLPGRVFRLDFDRFSDYALALAPDAWSISGPTGLEITSATVSAAFWWKAFNVQPGEQDVMVTEEVKYVFRELYHGCRARGMVKGNPPDFHDRLGKLAILRLAQPHFSTPRTLVTFRCAGVDRFANGPIVAKSLASRLTATGAALYTTEVDPRQLHPDYPWFLQARVDSPADLTVFVCGERLFAFERSREHLESLDWRAGDEEDGNQAQWRPFTLSAEDERATRALLADLGVEWGRIDLMRTNDGRSVFLEFNANGQWNFLDPDHRVGVLDAVAQYLTSPSSRPMRP